MFHLNSRTEGSMEEKYVATVVVFINIQHWQGSPASLAGQESSGEQWRATTGQHVEPGPSRTVQGRLG